jgi:hypothetical protein
MTEAELLRALAEARQPDAGEGSTVRDLCAATGWGERRVRAVLKMALAEGTVRVTRKQITDMSCRVQSVPSYVVAC